jgi:hypothetical protein
MSLLVFFLIKLLFGLIDQVALAFMKLIVLYEMNFHLIYLIPNLTQKLGRQVFLLTCHVRSSLMHTSTLFHTFLEG